MGDASAEPDGTGVDLADSNDSGRRHSGLAPLELDGGWAICAALGGKLGMLGAFLLYFEVGTADLRTDDIDERAEAGTGIMGN